MSLVKRAFLTALVAVALHAALLLTKVYTHPSHSVLAVFHLGGAQTYHPGFVVAEGYPLDHHGYGTDGQQYLYVAHDPLAFGEEMARAIDAPRYRYGRILLPGLASAVCLGSSRCLPHAIIGLNLAFVGGIGAIMATLTAEAGASFGWGLLLACSGSLACATDLGNVEVAAQFFGILGVLAYERGKLFGAVAAWAAAALARESYILLPVGFALALALSSMFGGDGKMAGWRCGLARQATRVAALLSAGVPWALWNVYLRVRLPADPQQGATSNLSAPFFGILDHVVGFAREPRITGSTVVTVAVAVPFLIIMARHTWALRGDRSGLAVATFLFVLLGVVASPFVWVRAGGFARALDFIYPGAVLTALRRSDRTTALFGLSMLIQSVNILLDHLFVAASP